jgi:serine phosphatase RsbU (regulator of sigma subunit)
VIRRLALALRHRYSGWKTYLWATALGTVLLVAVGDIASARTLLGIPGSATSLIVIVAAVLAGPFVGVAVALSLTVAFYGAIADFGEVSSPVGSLVGMAIWVSAALLTGLVADAMRAAGSERDEIREHRELYQLLEAGLVPGTPLADPEMGVVTRYIPSEQRMRLGGDFLDVRRAADGQIAFVVGDVAGHGPQAAALSATLRAAWQGLILSQASPALLVRSLNEVVRTEGREECPFVTAVFGWLDVTGRRLTYLLAGHPPILLAGDPVRQLAQRPHLPLGIEDDIVPTFHAVDLRPPCTVFAYTDGLIDARARRSGGPSPERWLQDRLGGAEGCLTEEHLDSLIAAALGPARDPKDDIAVLALCVLPDGVPLESGADRPASARTHDPGRRAPEGSLPEPASPS